MRRARCSGVGRGGGATNIYFCSALCVLPHAPSLILILRYSIRPKRPALPMALPRAPASGFKIRRGGARARARGTGVSPGAVPVPTALREISKKTANDEEPD